MTTTPNMASSAFQMLTALGIVLGGLIIVFYLMKRYLKRDVTGSKGQLIKVIANQYIGIKKNIALIQIPGTILVLGVSNDQISLLTKIEDTAIIEAIQKETSEISPSFSDHLQRLTVRFKSAKTSE